MKAVQSFAIASILALCVSACHRAEPRWGGCSGGRAIPGDFTMFLNYELQGDLYTGAWDESKKRPVFVILWKGSGQTSSYDGDNRLTSINGHRLSLSLTNRAVYALQPDYSVRDLGFSDPELSEILNAIANDTPIEGDLWTNKLAPRLYIVH
jgi:hypothetical protein